MIKEKETYKQKLNVHHEERKYDRKIDASKQAGICTYLIFHKYTLQDRQLYRRVDKQID